MKYFKVIFLSLTVSLIFVTFQNCAKPLDFDSQNSSSCSGAGDCKGVPVIKEPYHFSFKSSVMTVAADKLQVVSDGYCLEEAEQETQIDFILSVDGCSGNGPDCEARWTQSLECRNHGEEFVANWPMNKVGKFLLDDQDTLTLTSNVSVVQLGSGAVVSNKTVTQSAVFSGEGASFNRTLPSEPLRFVFAEPGIFSVSTHKETFVLWDVDGEELDNLSYEVSIDKVFSNHQGTYQAMLPYKGLKSSVRVIAYPIPSTKEFKGHIDSASRLENGDVALFGWSCLKGFDVNLETQFKIGQEKANVSDSVDFKIINSYRSESAVNISCENSSKNLRFAYIIPKSVADTMVGQSVYAYTTLSTLSDSLQFELNNSGLITIPNE